KEWYFFHLNALTMCHSLPLLLLLFPFISSHPVVIRTNGSTYSLNSGLCEDWSCGQEEARGLCSNYIFSGRSAHYCKCNIPFTGSFCDNTLHLNTTLPDSRYSECPFPLYCASVYGNGECNQECNSIECLYDGYECQVPSVCPKEEYCSDRFSDGKCDKECMQEECEFDGGDCFSSFDTLPGQLFVRLQTTSEQFMPLSHLFLFQLSRFLRATVVLSQDSVGPLLWRWGAEGRGGRIHRGENSSLGIEVALSISLTRCSHDCLDSIDRIIGFIEKAIASKSTPVSSAIIQSVSSSPPSPSPSFPYLRILFLCIGSLLIISILVYVVIEQRRTRKRVLEAPVWFPPELGGIANEVVPVKQSRLFPPSISLIHELAKGVHPIHITSGDDVNVRDERGMTPLLVIIRSERLEDQLRETMKELIKEGAQIDDVDNEGWGALHHSFHKLRSPNFNRWLISLGANPIQVDKKGRSLVHLATEYNDLPNLQMILSTAAVKLINLADDSNRIALSMAVSDCTLPIARCLLTHGADVDSNGDMQLDGDLPQKCPLHHAVECNSKEHVMLLINQGCRMHVLDNRHRTALHYAVQHGDLQMCRILVDAGIQVDARDDEDRTAEDMAAGWGMEKIREYLDSVRGRNEPFRKRRKLKRYSDQGYGSEESQLHSRDETDFVDRPSDTVSSPLPPLILSPRQSFGIPKWGTMAQLPMFTPGPVKPLSWMTTPLANFPSVLTPSHRVLHSTFYTLSSLAPPPLFPSDMHTPT
ncbi:hypothetical protein PMAYCL1PPCAC_29808, partial [Pristionchus mayeri]